MRIQSQITVDRPPTEVFEAITAIGNTPKWSAAAEREWWVSEPPPGVGSVRHQVGTALGQRFEADATVTAWDPPRAATLRVTADVGQIDIGFRFEPSGAGTRVTVSADLRLRGAARFAAPMVASSYRHQWESDLATFKRMVEAGELDPSGV
jgi:carbon monoxide dehydrogenase subunit G